MSKKQPSRSRALAAHVLHHAFQIVKENGGEMLGREVVDKVAERATLDAWALERYSKTNYIRWQSMIHFFSIDCMKAGFLVKKNGIWYLTPEGEKALDLGETGMLDLATQRYREWRKANPKEESSNSKTEHSEDADEGAAEDEEKEEVIALEQAQEIASASIESYISQKNPYEFQDLVAALLRGMGYYTPFIAPKGKDGGVDVLAYRDPLGTQSPRIKVQVKHKPNSESKVTVQEVRQLVGILQKDGDVGLFVSSQGFTPDAKTTARDSHVHVELIDLSRFIELWQEFYLKLSDEDKAKLPLTPVYFITPVE